MRGAGRWSLHFHGNSFCINFVTEAQPIHGKCRAEVAERLRAAVRSESGAAANPVSAMPLSLLHQIVRMTTEAASQGLGSSSNPSLEATQKLDGSILPARRSRLQHHLSHHRFCSSILEHEEICRVLQVHVLVCEVMRGNERAEKEKEEVRGLSAQECCAVACRRQCCTSVAFFTCVH